VLKLSLRSVPAKGNGTVVKLFNAIQDSQIAASTSAQEVKAARGTGKPTLPAPKVDDTTKKKHKHKNNASVARPNEGSFPYFVASTRHFNSMSLAR